MKMGFIWFWLVAFMFVTYVVLDGFDIGVGILQPFLARSENERQLTLRSIGPVWNGNEVWLIAGGGTLYFAFPLLYASAFSGFYLALTMMLWLLIMRGLGIELRMQLESDVWRTFFDSVFFVSSLLLAAVFGIALANVIRGVPLGGDGFFFLPLWTDWRVGPRPGILDWYTILGGLVTVAALALHGALYVAVKTEGGLQQRAMAVARRLWTAVLVVTLASVPASIIARPDILANYRSLPILFGIPVGVVLALAGILVFLRRQQGGRAFACSCAYLSLMLLGSAVALYPALLPSSDDPGRSITIEAALAGPYTLRVGLLWWAFGMSLAFVYFVVAYRLFRGKVRLESGGYGH
jgi:cytochrome bd ubiquinol oxidase subunit II